LASFALLKDWLVLFKKAWQNDVMQKDFLPWKKRCFP
jgi:hypothetical protein